MDVRPGATIQLANCEIRYAGLNGYPALRLDASAAQVSDCRIHDNAYRASLHTPVPVRKLEATDNYIQF